MEAGSTCRTLPVEDVQTRPKKTVVPSEWLAPHRQRNAPSCGIHFINFQAQNLAETWKSSHLDPPGSPREGRFRDEILIDLTTTKCTYRNLIWLCRDARGGLKRTLFKEIQGRVKAIWFEELLTTGRSLFTQMGVPPREPNLESRNVHVPTPGSP